MLKVLEKLHSEKLSRNIPAQQKKKKKKKNNKSKNFTEKVFFIAFLQKSNI